MSHGSIIPGNTATGKISNFTNHHTGVVINIGKNTLSSFLTAATAMHMGSAYTATHDLGIRMYMGTDITGSYSIIMVPVFSPKVLAPGTVPHQNDLEQTAFITTSTAFFGLLADSASNTIITNAATGAAKIINKDASGKELVFFTQSNLEMFLNGLVPVSNDYDFLVVTLTRETNSATGDLGMVMHCTKNGIQLLSNVAAWPVISGIYFDEGTLCPPPFLTDSSF